MELLPSNRMLCNCTVCLILFHTNTNSYQSQLQFKTVTNSSFVNLENFVLCFALSWIIWSRVNWSPLTTEAVKSKHENYWNFHQQKWSCVRKPVLGRIKGCSCPGYLHGTNAHPQRKKNMSVCCHHMKAQIDVTYILTMGNFSVKEVVFGKINLFAF